MKLIIVSVIALVNSVNSFNQIDVDLVSKPFSGDLRPSSPSLENISKIRKRLTIVLNMDGFETGRSDLNKRRKTPGLTNI